MKSYSPIQVMKPPSFSAGPTISIYYPTILYPFALDEILLFVSHNKVVCREHCSKSNTNYIKPKNTN